jgi:hypothetical protein
MRQDDGSSGGLDRDASFVPDQGSPAPRDRMAHGLGGETSQRHAQVNIT